MGTLVENREENGEGSAWLARVGAPLRRVEKALEGTEIPFIIFFPENFSNRACNPPGLA